MEKLPMAPASELVSTLPAPRIPNRCCSLAREFVIGRESQETFLRTTNNADQRARFQGNLLAGYYLTPVGRF
jgi:hypothetical protein